MERKTGLASKKNIKMIEIERKYLVTSDAFLTEYFAKNDIYQGYICSEPERTVRARIKGNKGFLTIKGVGNEGQISRFEWEKEIAFEDAKALLKLCEKGVIEKTRYEVQAGKHVVEVDVFYGENVVLILAEIELENENDTIEKPTWLGLEVTDDLRYYNAYLAKNPFKSW